MLPIVIDASPVLTLQRHNRSRQAAAREAATRYLGVAANEIALTDSTTMGVGLIYNGLRLRAGQELLTTTEQDYFVTHEALRQAALRTGASVRRLNLYDDTAGTAPVRSPSTRSWRHSAARSSRTPVCSR
jgi:isopenicillin-N epimerase